MNKRIDMTKRNYIIVGLCAMLVIMAVEQLDSSESDSIEKNISGEKMYTWAGNVGLVNVSDILRASTNPLCTSATTSIRGVNECNSNYLLDSGTASSLDYWTINAYSSESGSESNSTWSGYVTNPRAFVSFDNAYSSIYTICPVVFLKSDITLSGDGTPNNPFIIVS